VEAALRASGFAVTSCGRSNWDVQVPGKNSLCVQVDTQDDWLQLTASPGEVLISASAAWDAACRAGALPPLFKTELGVDRQVRLRADLPLCAGELLSTRLAQTIPRVPEALSTLKCAAESAPACELEEAATAGDSPERAVLARLLEECDWPFTWRGPNQAAVSLEVFTGAHVALVECIDAGVAAAVCLGSWPQLSPESRDALAVLLLGVAHVVPLVRGVVSTHAGQVAASLDVLLPADATGEELAETLRALSVACRLGAEEIKALEDSPLALHYLQVQRWTIPVTTKQIERNQP
jgi:hypothetical protein